MSDANNQFHYFRLTADDRILWGGYDAIYHLGSRVGPELDRRPATFDKLEAQFFRAFPQLEGLRFPYRWGGAIDTTTRFTVTFGQTLGGRVTYALGYTGLGVGASRWAGGVVRDLILRPDADRLDAPARARARRSPSRPSRSARVAVNLVRRELDRADRNEGRRGDPAPDARRARDRLRLVGRGARRQTGVGQPGRAARGLSVASGSEPWPRTRVVERPQVEAATRRGPRARRRSRSISRWPIL